MYKQQQDNNVQKNKNKNKTAVCTVYFISNFTESTIFINDMLQLYNKTMFV